MKKILSFAIVMAMLSTLFLCFATNSSAAPAGQKGPDWLITEMCVDQQGDVNALAGWSDGKDVFEFVELYNNSGIELNLYEYCLIYNGNKPSNEKFETVIVESTPIKGGDYFDGTDFSSSDKHSIANKGENPESCYVAPGECVVLWIKFHESYLSTWNDGKGMSMTDFRTFYGISEDVKVIMVDGNSNVDNGGHDKNFNLKNSAAGTYGIARYTDLMKQANVEGGTVEMNWTDCQDIVSWVTLDFDDGIGKSIANYSYTFTIDETGSDIRRLKRYSIFKDPTPGYLDTELMCSLYGVQLSKGQTVKLDGEEFILEKNQVIKGYNINGELKEGETVTFVAPADGLYKFEVVIDEVQATEPPANTDTDTEPTPTETEPTETEPTETKDEGTKAPAETEPTEKKGGCASIVVSSTAVIVMACAAAVALKKKL